MSPDKITNGLFQPQPIKPTIQPQTVAIPIIASPLEAINLATKILMGASGINIYQAKTCVYHAVLTHLLDILDLIPPLIAFGDSGTGKTWLLKQLSYFVYNPKELNVKTSAALRRLLTPNTTAIVEEADKIDEQLIINRSAKATSQIAVTEEREQGGWQIVTHDIFGATIVHRRKPPADIALRNRSVYIATKLNSGNYRIDDSAENSVIAEFAKSIKFSDIRGKGRTQDVWLPLISVGRELSDTDWLNYADIQMELDRQRFLVGQDYEPQKAVESIVEMNLKKLSSVPLKDIKRDLKDYHDVYLTIVQIDELCNILGYKVTHTDGYPEVKAK